MLSNLVTIHPTKTKVSRNDINWSLGDNLIYSSNETTQLGLLKAELKENDLNIEARLSIARRTMYSLMNTGVHGTNGLNPQTSYKIYQCYVMPRLLYGLEILSLNQKQLDILSRLHT